MKKSDTFEIGGTSLRLVVSLFPLLTKHYNKTLTLPVEPIKIVILSRYVDGQCEKSRHQHNCSRHLSEIHVYHFYCQCFKLSVISFKSAAKLHPLFHTEAFWQHFLAIAAIEFINTSCTTSRYNRIPNYSPALGTQCNNSLQTQTMYRVGTDLTQTMAAENCFHESRIVKHC